MVFFPSSDRLPFDIYFYKWVTEYNPKKRGKKKKDRILPDLGGDFFIIYIDCNARFLISVKLKRGTDRWCACVCCGVALSL